ncbi:MAG TPA: TadG family pilus assembly protein [Hyphomicrobium sp.]|mgnify:FL=1|nr:TadG family pilus assembly protein [Hyphomicrobium sp.]HRO48567.1 TadG family pilus assembly protein [Hyphomicrobium sp.]
MTRCQVRCLLSDTAGSIGVVLAFFLMVAVSLCALAIDVGSLYLERRTMQGAVDLAAVAAAGDLERAEAAARATLAANGFGAVRALSVVKGRYERDRTLAPGDRFVAGQEPFNAVRLDVAAPGHLYFAKSFMAEPEISVSAIGSTDARATFSIGSRLLAVRGGLANAILGALLGGNISLSVMDYEALVNADVRLLDFLSALATELDITAGTYGDVLDADVGIGQVLRAVATAAQAQGDTTAASVVTTLASRADASLTVPLNALVDLGPLAHAEVGPAHPGLGAGLDALSLVTAAAQLANGNRQVAINLGTHVPGLLALTLDVAIGEPAQHSGWVTTGQAGATVRTAQTRLRLVAEVGGTGLLLGARVRLPIYIELARAEARLKSVTCQGGSGDNAQAVVTARPAVVKAWIGDVPAAGLAAFNSGGGVPRGNIVQAPLVTVTARASAEMSHAVGDDLRFTQRDVDAREVKTVSVRDHVSSLTGSLLQSATLHVEIAGLGLGLSTGAIKSIVIGLLTPVTATLDGLLQPLLELLGVSLGEVDVRVHGISCGNAALSG